MSGRALKDLGRSYDSLATKAFNDGNSRLGEAYSDAAKALSNVIDRQAPSIGKELSDVGDKYSDFLRIQRAAGKSGAEEGMFSPNHLKQSIRDLDKSADKRSFARGTSRGRLLKEAEMGSRVLGPTIPPVGPGTAEKMAIPMAMQNSLAVLPALAAQLAS